MLNIKALLKKPFLWIKTHQENKRKINEYLKFLKHPKIIIAKREELHNIFLQEDKRKNPDEEKINKLKGWIQCIDWFFAKG